MSQKHPKSHHSRQKSSSGEDMACKIAMSHSIAEQMRLYAKECLPNEACGMLIGIIDSNTHHIHDMIQTPNQAESPVSFVIPDSDVIRVYQMAAERNVQVVGVYHSHPDSPAVPSATDAKYMELNPGVWVIHSGQDGHMRAWILDGHIYEIDIHLYTDA